MNSLAYVGFRACFADLGEADDWSKRLVAFVSEAIGPELDMVGPLPPEELSPIVGTFIPTGGIIERFDEGADAPAYRHMIKMYASVCHRAHG